MAIESKRSAEKQKTTRLNLVIPKSDQEVFSPNQVKSSRKVKRINR